LTDQAGEPAAVLAIDGGNSKTDMALVGWDGQVLAARRGPGASQEYYGVDGALRRLADQVSALAAEAGLDGAVRGGPDPHGTDLDGTGPGGTGTVARHVSACLAGADLPEEEAALSAALAAQGWSRAAVVVNDTFAVLRAGSADERWGAAVTCGAGTNCVAVGPDGAVARYLSHGTLTGDWGGGHSLSREVMWHAMRGWDGRGPATALGDAAAACFGLASVRDVAVAVHRGELSGADLHRLTWVLFAVAASGDPVACSLVTRQAVEVCTMAAAALRRIGLSPAGVPVVLGGGLLESRQPLLLAEIDRELTVAAPGAVRRVLDVPPLAGAALLGLDAVAAPAAARQRLIASYRPARA
jgi:N-acetylglucosamine kinase-like BadF-type ATPase